jgi:HAD superfamily hydrolase (TIGR01509 family)
MKLELPPGQFQAYLFDCDGTIADSMPLHYIAWTSVLREWNCAFEEELFYSWGGKPAAQVVADLNRLHGLSMPPQAVAERKERQYYQLLPQLKVVPEVLEHIEAQEGKIPFAVVTGSRRQSVMATLNAIGLLEKFKTLVCAGDYQNGKPHPEPFLLAAARLGVPAESCLVFEDTGIGLAAAAAAGMAAVKVPMRRQE